MMMAASSFVFGFFAVYHGFKRIFADSKLRAWAIVPLMVASLVFLILGIAGFMQLIQFVPMTAGVISNYFASLFGLDPNGWIYWLAVISLWPVCLVVLGFGLYIVARLLAAPFYSILAERALVHFGVLREKPFGFSEWTALTLRMATVSFVKTLIFAAMGLVLLAFSLIPGLNILATIGFIHMVAFDVADYGFEALEWKLQQRFAHFRQHLPDYSGMACGLGVAMLIPGLNLVVLPAAVVGASEVLARTLRQQMPSARVMKDVR